jgi:uncharacterized protein DUF4242
MNPMHDESPQPFEIPKSFPVRADVVATYLDIHVANGRTAKRIQSLVGDKPDEFGVSHIEFYINEGEDKMLCFHEAPDEEAVVKHHDAAGLKCDWIIRVDRIS